MTASYAKRHRWLLSLLVTNRYFNRRWKYVWDVHVAENRLRLILIQSNFDSIKFDLILIFADVHVAESHLSLILVQSNLYLATLLLKAW